MSAAESPSLPPSPHESGRPAREEAAELLKIGDFARIAGTNLRTLRYYEELGLLQPAMRSEGGFRYYRRTDLNRLRLIRNLQELGLPLEHIRDLVDTRAPEIGREELLLRVGRAIEQQRHLVSQRIADLEAQRQRLDQAGRKLSQCANCPHTPRVQNNFCEPCQHTGEALPEYLSALF